MRKPNKAARGAALIAAIAAIVGSLQLATPPPAAAISGLQRTSEFSPLFHNEPSKSAEAQCPTGKLVIGGGAWVFDGNRKLVRLTRMNPYTWFGSKYAKDSFTVGAEAPNLRSDFNWTVLAYAICANKLGLWDYQIVSSRSPEPSKTFQTAAARCPSGTVAFGSGAEVSTPGGQVGLQLNRTSGPLDLSRASGRESATGYARDWHVLSTAICAQPQARIHAEGNIEPGAEATDYCDSGYFTHGPGGGGGLTDGGPVWLQKIYPHEDLGGVDVGLTGPLYPSIGGMVASQTCAGDGLLYQPGE